MRYPTETDRAELGKLSNQELTCLTNLMNLTVNHKLTVGDEGHKQMAAAIRDMAIETMQSRGSKVAWRG